MKYKRFLSVFMSLLLLASSINPALAATFAPGMAKRDGPGTFAGAPIVQGVGGTNGGDLTTILRGNQINSNWYQNLDPTQGTISFWITPEWDGNDGLQHDIINFGSPNTVQIGKKTDGTLGIALSGVIWYYSVDVSDWSAGTTHNVVISWDNNNTIDGSNYIRISIDDTHSYGRSSPTAFSSPSSTIHVGSDSTGSRTANAIIEGLTIYRRPLFDGTNGIDVGNGDEIAAIYNSGSGADPILTTGSWDVVFALPTNASVGALTTGTGQTWSHPHSSNLLYTSTTNTGGFMMNGTASNDGWNEIPWYEVGGAPTPVAAYQPIGADSLADSYVNLANPGTNDAEPGVAPTWASGTGWTFNGSTQYLTTGVVPVNDQSWSAILRFNNFTSSTGFMLGANEVSGDPRFYLGRASDNQRYANGAQISPAVAHPTSGVQAFAGASGYMDGSFVTSIPTAVGTATQPLFIGARNTGNPANYMAGNIQATAIYDNTLDATQVANVTDAMEALDSDGSYLDISTLASNEKIFAGGYKFTSSGADQGIYYDLDVTAGDDWVVRALAHSDGTSIPKIILYDQTNGAEIGSLTGTATSTRTDPDVFIFTGEAPADMTTLRVKLVNTQSSGTTYWHQVEVLPNLVNNPSFAEWDVDPPQGPRDWIDSTFETGDLIQESSDVHTGPYSLRMTATGSPDEIIRLDMASTTGVYYAHGTNAKRIGGGPEIFMQPSGQGQNPPQTNLTGSTNRTLGASETTRKNYYVVSRATRTINQLGFRSWNVGHDIVVDDAYQFALDLVPLTVTPASEANSTENGDEIRVDGRDTYIASSGEAVSVGAATGYTSFNYRPRHSAADAVKFTETTADDAYVVSFNGDADDYIRVYWDSANTLRMSYSMAGTTDAGTWDATGAIAANTEYPVVVNYTGGGNMVLSVAGTDRITLSSIPAAFGTAPNTVYLGSDTDGANQGDATFSELVFDNDAPSISLTALSPDPNSDNTPTLTGTATEAIGTVASVEFQMDGTGGSWTACTADDGAFDEASEAFSCTAATLTDGSHTMYVRATDSNSNTTAGGSETADTFTIDATDPASIELDSPGDNSYTNNERPTFRWKATSDATAGLSKYVLEIDNGDTGDFTINDIPVSRTEAYEESRYKIIYDGFSDSDDNNNYISVYTKSSLNWGDTDNDGKLKEGGRTWTVKAVDSVGNETFASRTLFVDRTNPVTTLTQVNSEPYSSGTVQTTDTTPTIYGKITDPLSHTDDSTADQNENGPKVASGPKQVEIKIEKLNNFGLYDLESLYTINMDKSWYTCDDSEVTDNTKQKCDKYLPFEYTPDEALGEGEYRVTLTGKDKVDNGSDTSFTLTIGTFADLATDEEQEAIEEELQEHVGDDDLTEEEQGEIREELEEETEITRVEGPGLLERLADGIANLFSTILSGAGRIALGIARGVGSGIALVFDTTGSATAFGWETTGKLIALAGQGVQFGLNGLATGIDVIGEALAGAGMFVGDRFSALAARTSGRLENMLAGIDNAITGASVTTAKAISSAGKHIAAAGEAVQKAGANTGKRTAAVPGKAAFAVKEAISNVTFSVGQGVQDTSERAGFALVKFGYLFVNEPTTIANVEVEVLSPESAKITWETNHPANGKVNWGFGSGDYEFELQDDKRVTEHEFTLTDLTPDTEYHFEVMSQNKNYVYDANRKFRTAN